MDLYNSGPFLHVRGVGIAASQTALQSLGIAKTPKTPMTGRLTFHIDTERTERSEAAADVSA